MYENEKFEVKQMKGKEERERKSEVKRGGENIYN